MKKTKVLWSNILEELERTPIIQVVCEKLGISRQTFYRWMNESEENFNDVKKALSAGVNLVNDVAESNILNAIKNKDLASTKYWLSHRHESYKKPFTHRDATGDIFEMKRIEDYYRNRKNIEKALSAITREEAEANTIKALAFMEKWTKQKDNSGTTLSSRRQSKTRQ